jgi:hypothetical protein
MNPAVFLTGICAAVFLTGAPMLRDRRAILLAQLGASLCFASHYALLGLAAASAANVLGTVQIVAALFAARSAAMNRLGFGLICLMMVAGVVLWEGPISALGVTATALIALGRMQRDEVHLRLLLLVGGGFWIAHDFIAAAWIPLLADIGAILAGVVALSAMFVSVSWRPRASMGLPA